MKPKVSICVPIYRVENYIERCVRSICEQTLNDLEIIFINDCSPDKSWQVLIQTIREYPQRKEQIRLLENYKNLGPGVSRQRCLEIASGEFIYFADADDWLELDMLEKMYNIALQNKADIVGTNVNYVTSDGKVSSSQFLSDLSNEDFISKMLKINNNNNISIALWTRLIRKSIYDKTLLDQNQIKDLVRYEDFLNVVKCHYFANRVYWIENPLYNHFLSNVESITKITDYRAIESKIRVARLLENFFSTVNCSTYENSIKSFKIKAKNGLILFEEFLDPVRWRTLWPELNTYYSDLPIRSIIAMKLASKKYDYILHIYLKLIRIIKKFFRNL